MAASNARCESWLKRLSMRSSARLALTIFIAPKVSWSREVRLLLATRLTTDRRRKRGVKAMVRSTIGTVTSRIAPASSGSKATTNAAAMDNP